MSLLHAYDTPAHERRIGEQLADGLPTAHVSLSSDVLPDIMEYERASTTVANAYIAPVMELYLGNLVERLLAPVQSTALRHAVERRSRLGAHDRSSGCADGALGPGCRSRRRARRRDRQPEADLHDDRHGRDELRHSLFGRGGGEHLAGGDDSGHPIAVAALDIHTLGAGGGRSPGRLGRRASDRPTERRVAAGPGVLGRGGEPATVTDANVVLGRLGAELLVGGSASTPTRRIVRSSDRSRDRSASTSSRRRAEWSRSSTQPWRRGCISCRWDEAATHALSASSASAARARCTPASSRPRSAAARSSSRCCRGTPRRSASCSRISAASGAKPSSRRWPRSTRAPWSRSSTGLRTRSSPTWSTTRRQARRSDPGGRAALVRGTALPARHPVPRRRVGWRTVLDGSLTALAERFRARHRSQYGSFPR